MLDDHSNALLIDLNDNVKIYTNVDAFEFSDITPDVKLEIWGEYRFKPVAQVEWEAATSKAIKDVCQIDSKKSDLRPKLFDHKTSKWLLLDTGAACSVYPKHYFPDALYDHTRALRAVNGTAIPTFGTQQGKQVNVPSNTL